MNEDTGATQPPGAASFCRSIVYGSVASAIKNPEGDHTHRWTLYVRGFNDEDISSYVKKVVFKLHESFQQPNRAVDKFPFEVSETGWGEFQIQIKIYFHDAPEKPLLLVHNLRLYEAGEDLEAQLKNDCKPVVAENYEEIIFDPPPAKLVPALQEAAALHDPSKAKRYPELKMKENGELARLDSVLEGLEAEIAALAK